MIINARYIGPYLEVSVPGWENKLSRRGPDGQHPVVTLRMPDHQLLAGCWEPVEVAPEATTENVADLPDAGGDTAHEHEDGER